jgi:hypothetical protein
MQHSALEELVEAISIGGREPLFLKAFLSELAFANGALVSNKFFDRAGRDLGEQPISPPIKMRTAIIEQRTGISRFQQLQHFGSGVYHIHPFPSQRIRERLIDPYAGLLREDEIAADWD